MSKFNNNIIYWFDLLVKQLQFYVDTKYGNEKIIHSFKLDSISKSLDIIKSLKFAIKSGDDLKGIPRIGKGTIRRVDEILKTGQLAEVKDAIVSGEYLDYVDELEQVFGIGHAKAYDLVVNFGITNIIELKKAHNSGKIKLPSSVAKGLKFVDKIKTGIKRDEMDKICKYLIETGIEFDPNIDVRFCGSYRREKELMNDIDIMISHTNIVTLNDAKTSNLMTNFINILFKNKFMIESLTSVNVPTKFMGLCQLKSYPIRRIDMRFIPQESYYTALLYFTGSKDFNRTMRLIAVDMGYKLNEYHIQDQNKKPFIVNSEKDVFDILGMEYVQPQKR